MLYGYTHSHEHPNFRTIEGYATRHRRVPVPSTFSLVVVLGPYFFSSHATAIPLNNPSPQHSSPLKREAEQHHDVSPEIWIPILALGLIVIVGALGMRFRKSISEWIAQRHRPQTGIGEDGTRELTAEQLAGTINENATSGNTTTNTTRTRRNRRPRRTPSQISTTSLPAYAKEPGEQELVIFRGPEDMEDAGMPQATVIMEPLSEDGEETLHSRDTSQSSQYPALPAIPATPMNEPLLQDDDSSADLSIQPPGTDMPRRSPRISDSMESPASAEDDAPAYDNERGEAPPYFEVVDIETGNNNPTEETSPTTPPLPESSAQRRSGFRTLLHSLPNRLSMHGPSHTHTASHARAESSSAMSSETSHGREASQSRASHRPSASGSSSVFSLSHLRTLSRQKSLKNLNNNNLNSPSMISLDSISAPLAHTLTRTEFTYPKSGPTPEQLKLISSRDSFARFGVPYGADAIAFAASTSRQSLGLPPPDFDSPSGASYDSHPTPGPDSAGVGSSRLRTMSSIGDLGVASLSSSTTDPGLEATASMAPAVASPHSHESSLGRPAASSSGVSTSSPDTLQIPLQDSPNMPSTMASESLPRLLQPSQQQEHSSDIGTRAETRSIQSLSYRAPSIFDGGDRSVSRVSSAASYATASESILPHHQDSLTNSDDDDDVATPSTPKMGTKHFLESTDTTIKQNATTTTTTTSSGPSN